jgi:hypothetical protein
LFVANLRRNFTRGKKGVWGHEIGEQRNEIQDSSEGISFVEFPRETSCPSGTRRLTVFNQVLSLVSIVKE